MDVEQYGKIVTINGYIKINVTSTGDANLNEIGTLAGVGLPTNTVRVVCGVAGEAYNIPSAGILLIATDEKMSFKTSLSGNRAVYFSASYTTR